MNTWNGIGRLCNEPEIRYTAQKNEACANFRIAVDRKFKTEGRPDSDFFNCSAFGKTAEFVEKYIRKGMKVGVTAPFYLSKLFAPYFAEGASIVNISSSRDRMSQPNTESYTAAKGGISALTHALAVSFSGKVRVNSISPGWIDTNYTVYEGPDATQQLVGRVGNPPDIANMVLYICSDMAGFITGENICIDGGMTKLMIYHGDHGWKLEKKEN